MNLLFAEVSGAYCSDFIQKLEEKGLTVSHFTSAREPRYLKEIGVDFANRQYVDARRLYNIEVLRQHYEPYFAPLTSDILDFFSFIERDFFILTDRANFHSVSVMARKRLYFDLIRFWVGYLQQEKIDAVYFPCTPHAPWELVLMQAAKYLDLPYCWLGHTAINNRSMLRSSYTQMEAVPAHYLEGKDRETLKASIAEDLYNDYAAESIVTSVVKLQNDMFQKQLGVNTNAKNYEGFYKTELKRHSFGRQFNKFKGFIKNILKHVSGTQKDFRFATAMDQAHRFLGWERDVVAHKAFAKALKAKYETLAKALDLEQNYIYFPLHLQPELTSQPEAGYFEDQLLALETLLAALPEGWLIYAKENPRQFDTSINTLSAMHFRTPYDFDLFTKDPRVKLVPQSIKSEDLIAKAQITATLTGTAGWEALELGKPCMTFGSPWYSPCQSCFVVKMPDDVSAALKQAEQKTPDVVQDDVLRYLSYYQDKLIIGTFHAPSDVSYNSVPYDTLVDCHAAALVEFVKARLSAPEIKKKSA